MYCLPELRRDIAKLVGPLGRKPINDRYSKAADYCTQFINEQAAYDADKALARRAAANRPW